VIDELPADLAALREASSQLVFHYRGDGDRAGPGASGAAVYLREGADSERPAEDQVLAHGAVADVRPVPDGEVLPGLEEGGRVVVGHRDDH
jgi:hypothetical protein